MVITMKKSILIAILCMTVLLLNACAKETEKNVSATAPEEQLVETKLTEALPASEGDNSETEIYVEPPWSILIQDLEDLEVFWNSTDLDETAYAVYAEEKYCGEFSQEDVAQIKEALSEMPFPYAADYGWLGMVITPEDNDVVIKYRANDVCTFRYDFGKTFDEEEFRARPESYTPVPLLSTEEVQSCYMAGEEDYTIKKIIQSCYVLNVGGSQVNMILLGQRKELAAESIANFKFWNIEDLLAERRANPIDPTLTFASHRDYWDFLQCVFMETLDMSGYLHDNGYIEKGISGRKDVMRVSKMVQDLPIPKSETMEISSLRINPETEIVEVQLTDGEETLLCRLGGGVPAPPMAGVDLQSQSLPEEIQDLSQQMSTDQAAGVQCYTAMVEDYPMELLADGMTQTEVLDVLAGLTFFNLNTCPEA